MQTSDPEMLAAAIRNANVEPCQLSAHPAPSKLARVVWPQMCLDVFSLGPAMLFSGAMPQDCFTLVFVLACPGKAHSFNFSTEHTDGYMGFFPPGGALDSLSPENHSAATLTVSAAAFHAALASCFPDIPDNVLAHGAGMRIGPAEQARLRGLLSAVEGMLWQPGDALASTLARRHLERDLLEVFFAALRSGCSELVAAPTPRAARRHRRLQQARDYIATHVGEPIGLDDLCAATSLSHRGVEYLFQDMLGVSPIVYLRHQRLHNARRALRHAEPAFGVVKQVALDCGFWHPGHFSHEYRALFGENPSATMRQPIGPSNT